MRVTLVTVFSILISCIVARGPPFLQPYCKSHPQIIFFYKHHYEKMQRYRYWLCDESFEDKLKLCVQMYAKSMQKPIEEFKTLTENEAVEADCEPRSMHYFEPIETSLEHLLFKNDDEKPKMTLTIDMFKCPISKMGIKFKGSKRKEKRSETKDFYITVGRNLLTVAVLRDSLKGGNICLEDVHYYPEAKPKLDDILIPNTEWRDK